MKKTFLLINSIILLVSCSTQLSQLVEKDGVSYKGDIPYTGVVVQKDGEKVLEGSSRQ